MLTRPLSFYQKSGKRAMDITISLLGLLFCWPFFLLLAILIKLDSPGPVIFKQKRVGKNGKVFTLYKFRTMIEGAENLQKKYQHLNEANGSVFKIKNDPRYTRLGKILSRTGLDELPQLVNVLAKDMSLVGPRPLPIMEEAKIPKRWRVKRREVKPGLASSWLVKGAHNLSFIQWMNFDIEDINNSGFRYDLTIFLKITMLGINLVKNEVFGNRPIFPS